MKFMLLRDHVLTFISDVFFFFLNDSAYRRVLLHQVIPTVHSGGKKEGRTE